jgi:hypothetical protein
MFSSTTMLFQPLRNSAVSLTLSLSQINSFTSRLPDDVVKEIYKFSFADTLYCINGMFYNREMNGYVYCPPNGGWDVLRVKDLSIIIMY